MTRTADLIHNNYSLDQISKKIDEKTRMSQTPLITLSREVGVQTKQIAASVAHILGTNWKVFDHEIIADIAKQAHVQERLVEYVDEKHISLVQELVDDVFGEHYINLEVYHRNLIKVITAIGAQGNAIIVGHGAQFIVPSALKVRAFTDSRQQIANIMHNEQITEDEAEKRIATIDKEQRDFMEAVFKREPHDITSFDLVIQLGPVVTPEDAARIIAYSTKQRFHL